MLPGNAVVTLSMALTIVSAGVNLDLLCICVGKIQLLTPSLLLFLPSKHSKPDSDRVMCQGQNHVCNVGPKFCGVSVSRVQGSMTMGTNGWAF